MEKKVKIKSTRIIIRIEENQKEKFEKAAEKSEKFLSRWIRDVLDKEAEKVLKIKEK